MLRGIASRVDHSRQLDKVLTLSMAMAIASKPNPSYDPEATSHLIHSKLINPRDLTTRLKIRYGPGNFNVEVK
jgi:hypothetical protein